MPIPSMHKYFQISIISLRGKRSCGQWVVTVTSRNSSTKDATNAKCEWIRVMHQHVERDTCKYVFANWLTAIWYVTYSYIKEVGEAPDKSIAGWYCITAIRFDTSQGQPMWFDQYKHRFIPVTAGFTILCVTESPTVFCAPGEPQTLLVWGWIGMY